jgi:hypothetical protein
MERHQIIHLVHTSSLFGIFILNILIFAISIVARCGSRFAIDASMRCTQISDIKKLNGFIPISRLKIIMLPKNIIMNKKNCITKFIIASVYGTMNIFWGFAKDFNTDNFIM